MATPVAAGRVYYGWIIVAACLLLTATAFGIQYCYGIFFKPLQQDFGWSRATTASVMSFHMIFYGISAFISGWCTDRYGPRMTVAAGGLLMGLGLVLSSQISAVWQLYLLYSLPLAFGISTCWYPIVTTLSRWFSGRRGLALGTTRVGHGLGILGISPLVNYLITMFDWRLSYIIVGLIAWAVIVPTALLLKKEPRETTYAPLPTDMAPSVPQFSLRDALRTPNLWFLIFMQLLCSVCFRMVMVHLVPYATDVGISAATASLVLGLIGGANIIGGVLMGIAQDRFGARASFIISVLLQSISLFWLTTLRTTAAFFGFALLFGFTLGGYMVQFYGLTAGLFGLRSVGAINGALGTGAGIGGALGPFSAGYFFDRTASYSVPFLIAAGALLLAGLLAISLRSPSRSQHQPPNAVPGV